MGASDSDLGHRRRRRRPGENRDLLIEAGIVEFARLGYRAASTAEIAAHAEVPQPHVYASFRSKGELFLACVARALDGGPGNAQDPPASLLHSQQLWGSAHLTDTGAALVVQAVAALGQTDIGEQLRPTLATLRGRIGDAEFAALLLRGADVLGSDVRADDAHGTDAHSAGIQGSVTPGDTP